MGPSVCCFTITLLLVLQGISRSGTIESQYCHWSNEGCSSNADCCSQDCVQKHQGTNPRCERSSLFEPCYEDYHCEGGLACGETYTCCSPYWGICVRNNDCCDPNHVCRRMEDLTYKRCLLPSGASPHRYKHCILSTMFIIAYSIMKWT